MTTPDTCRTVTVRVALSFRRRGGRKIAIAADGSEWAPRRPRADSTLVKAIARAHRWQNLLGEGSYGTAAEIAAAEKISASYVSRILRPTLVAPDIIEAILRGQQPSTLEPGALLRPFSLLCDEQRSMFS